MIDPVAEYDHRLGSAVTGGYVYRGTQTASLFGRYLFADFGSGCIWAWPPEQASAARVPTPLLASGLNIPSFGQGNDGELYVVDYSGGLYHVNFTVGSSSNTVPNNLVDTGCVNPSNPMQAASGLIPYDINAAFWSDGASKERRLALPIGHNIAVENTYEWNDAQTAATRVQGGKTRTLANNQVWTYPSESQCMECHTNVAGGSLGLMTAQLNRSYLYVSTGRTTNQLDTLGAINVLSPGVNSATAAASKSQQLCSQLG